MTLPACALVAGAILLTGCGESGGLPAAQQVREAVALEIEACRRSFPEGLALVMGPAKTGRPMSGGGIPKASVDYPYEVPLLVLGEQAAGDRSFPLVGEVRFSRRAGIWEVDERHRRHWAAAGLRTE